MSKATQATAGGGDDDRSISPSTAASQQQQYSDIEDFIGMAGSDAKYIKVKLIGKGSFGQAWLVKRSSDKKQLVAKEMDMSSMTPRDVQYVKAEIECMSICRHFAIVEYIESVSIEKKMILIMEFADAGDLNIQIKNRAADGMKYFEEHEVAYTIVQLCLAIEHVHSLKAMHRDLKPANLFLMSNGLVKLGDFGFSHKYENSVSEAQAHTFCGTPYYLPPELYRRQLYSKKADVWSLGIILFEMMALKRPFIGQGMSGLKESVLKMNWSTELPSKFSRELRDVVMSILQPDPNKRPSTQQILETPYMKKILSDFERSVDASTSIDAEAKERVKKDLAEGAEARARAIKQQGSGNTGGIGPVGSVRTDVSYEGPIRKDSQGVWKERYFVLADGNLTITVKKGDKENKSLAISLLSSVVPVSTESAKAEGVFALCTRDQKQMWMQAPSQQACLEWVHAISQAMGIA